MQDLTLVGLTEDKSRLVLVSDSGEKYTLPADAKLRAALRGDHARPGQLENKMESALRPRDIQARIRSGESPEAVAEAARTTVDRIMSFATPVLAERAHIAERAQRSSIRRKAGEGPARVLGDVVAERLRGRNVDPDSVEWDAWRREDGRWTLVADFRSDQSNRRAEFVFDAPGRYVVAEDDAARWLVGESSPGREPQPGTTPSPRRLSAVTLEDELPLGVDAIDMVSDGRKEAAETVAAAEEPTLDLSKTAAAVRERRPVEAGDLTVETADADWMATQASERLAEHQRPAERERPAEQVEEEHVDAVAEAQVETEQEPAPEPPARKPARKKGRASVPSWDEIMFGGGRAE